MVVIDENSIAQSMLMKWQVEFISGPAWNDSGYQSGHYMPSF